MDCIQRSALSRWLLKDPRRVAGARGSCFTFKEIPSGFMNDDDAGDKWDWGITGHGTPLPRDHLF